MKSSGRKSKGSAAARFYAAQRGDDSARLQTEETPWSARVHGDPSLDAVHAVLEAFLNSREEDAVSFVSGFLQLTPHDRLAALAKLEGADKLRSRSSNSSGSAGGGAETAAPRGPVSDYGELRNRLQLEGQRAEQRAQRSCTSRGSSSSLCSSPAAARHHRHGAATPGAPARPLDSEAEDLETVEVGEGTRTGNLVAFFDRGVTSVPTNFDNFFAAALTAARSVDDIITIGSDTTATELEVEPETSSTPAPPSQRQPTASLPTLDEILGLDSDETDDASPVARVAPSAPAAPNVHEQSCHEAENESAGGVEVDAWSVASSSSEGSVDLPGLEAASAAPGPGAPAASGERNANVAAELQEVIAAPDDCVQTFHLDPLFDYDADALGAAARAGKAWREE